MRSIPLVIQELLKDIFEDRYSYYAIVYINYYLGETVISSAGAINLPSNPMINILIISIFTRKNKNDILISLYLECINNIVTLLLLPSRPDKVKSIYCIHPDTLLY